jgi:hypothetical protein
VRTSSGYFLRRGHDDVVKRVEERLAQFTRLPPEHGESLHVGGWLPQLPAGPCRMSGLAGCCGVACWLLPGAPSCQPQLLAVCDAVGGNLGTPPSVHACNACNACHAHHPGPGPAPQILNYNVSEQYQSHMDYFHGGLHACLLHLAAPARSATGTGTQRLQPVEPPHPRPRASAAAVGHRSCCLLPRPLPADTVNTQNGGQRTATVLIYLTDVEEVRGGCAPG